MTLSNGVKVHRLAEYFPIIEGEEYELLKEDIRKNGQLEPCVMINGELIDGINRMRACIDLGVAPMTEEYRGDDPLSYVISANIRRRHLDTSQRAMLATEMLPEFEKEAKERKSASAKTQIDESGRFSSKDEDRKTPRQWRDESSSTQTAKMFGVSGPSVQRAKRIKAEAPDKVQDIINGKATVTTVDAELREKKAAERAANKTTKAVDESVEENKRFVAEYFEAVKTFCDDIELAIVGAQRHKFDENAKNFVTTKHDRIRALMVKLEELI